MTVAIAVGPNTGNEYEAIRQMLEYFGCQVTVYFIGRPNDMIKILDGTLLSEKLDHLIFSFHGEKEAFVMPELDPSIYEPEEPRGNFGYEEVFRYGRFSGQLLINTGCTLGIEKIGQSFLSRGVSVYIGAVDYIEGNSILAFINRFYYEIITNHLTVKEAYTKAMSIDNETRLFTYMV